MDKQTYYFELSKPKDVYGIAITLAEFFPMPDQVLTGIYELLINGIEHGNLGIGFDAKNTLLRQGRWHDEIERRLAQPDNADKAVRIKITKSRFTCRLTIADSGNGFNWQQRLHNYPTNDRLHGRGLWIAMQSGFDNVLFNPLGNAVMCQSSIKQLEPSRTAVYCYGA